MAVEIKYVVVRKGEEKMSFANKKDADAYDKMLDLADTLTDWLADAPGCEENESREALALWLAENKEALSVVLRTGKLPEKTADVADISAKKSPDAA